MEDYETISERIAKEHPELEPRKVREMAYKEYCEKEKKREEEMTKKLAQERMQANIRTIRKITALVYAETIELTDDTLHRVIQGVWRLRESCVASDKATLEQAAAASSS